MPRRISGFTYIELMIVMGIIAVLTAIAVPNFLEAQVRASVARSYSDLAVLKMAVDAYRLETRQYPPNRTPGVANGWDLAAITTPVAYLSRLPLDTLNPGPSGPFHYYNAVQVDPKGLIFNPAGEAPPIGFAAGLLWGEGPAARNPNAVTPSFTINAEGLADFTSYNPTNGTTSAGDIFQIFP